VGPNCDKDSNGNICHRAIALACRIFLICEVRMSRSDPALPCVDTRKARAYAPVRDFGGVAKW
jgi:hypothetical protein